jgi:hypothetical protein
MVAVRLSAVVTEDRELIVQVPQEIPAGPVELLIQTSQPTSPAINNPAREIARAKLAAAGLLSNIHRLPIGTRIPTDDEVRAAGILPPGSRPSEDLIDEDRSER